MERFKNYLREQVVPTAQVSDGSIDIEKPAVRGQINATLQGVTAQPAVTPYVVLQRISKALAYFHIILPKRAYLEGDRGVEVIDVQQFGPRMGMTDQGEFIKEVPAKYFLFISYKTVESVGVTYAKPVVGGMFKVTAKLVDQVELDRLLSMAEISLAEDAACRQNMAKAMAPKEEPHTALGDCDCSQGDSPSTKSAISVSMRKTDKKLASASLDEAMSRKQKDMAVRLFMSHDPKAGESILKMGKKDREEKKSFASAEKEANKWQKHRLKEEEQLDEVNVKQIKKDIDSGMSHDAVIGKHANKRTTNTDNIRKVIKQHAWDKRMKKEETQINEGGMPASVIKHKQKLASMSPEELKKKFAGKSEEHLKSMARRHGYGKDSDVYSKHVKEESLDEAKKRTILVTRKGDPHAKTGGGVIRIPKDKYDPKKYNLASE